MASPAPDTPPAREIALPGDPPAGGVRSWAPVVLAAAGVGLAILGTMPESAWSWTDWRPSPSTYVFAHGSVLTVLTAGALFAMAITIVMLWAGRHRIKERAKKRPETDPAANETLLIAAVAAIVFGLIAALFLLGDDLDGELARWLILPHDAIPPEARVIDQGHGFTSDLAALPDWIHEILQAIYLAGIGLTALAALVVGGIRLRDLIRRSRTGVARSERVAGDVAKAAEESLEELELGGDPRTAIIRCYARFERSLAAAETPRAPWQTPMEFMRAILSSLPLDAGDVARLTRLFELARFSHHPLGTAEQDAALRSLIAIRKSLTEPSSDAPAG